MEPILIALLVISILLIPVVMLVGTFVVLRPWLRAFLHGTSVSVFSILGMRLRGNRAALLVDAYILLQRARVPATIRDVENIYIDNKFQIENSQDLVELVKRKIPAATTDNA